MTRPTAHGTGRRLVGLLAAASAFVGLAPIVSATAQQSTAATVTITVDSVSPVTPARTKKVRPFAVELTLTNTTDAQLSGVQVVGERGYPITSQSTLASALSAPANRGTGDLPITPTSPLTVDLAPDSSATVVFHTTYSLIDGHGLCVCHDAVYPLLFSARMTGSGPLHGMVLGTGATFVPVFYQAFTTEQVSWVWSLLDRPHRLDSDTTFQDDDLSQEVATGGRLDRALAVVEQVSPAVPFTIVLDPEILDELQVMASGPYLVSSGSGTVPGQGTDAAAAWLARLRAILSARPDDQVELTPLADPDVQSVLHHDATWSNTVPATIANRVATALGGHAVNTDLSWPASGRIDAPALASLASAGRTTVILDDASAGSLVQSRVVRFASGTSTVAGALTDDQLEASIGRAVTFAGAAAPALPALLSQLAVPVIDDPTAPHVAVLTGPQYVDPSVPDAVALIDTISDSTFTGPISLAQAVSSPYLPSTTSALRPSESPSGLPAEMFSTIGTVNRSASTVHSLLDVPRASSQDRSQAAAVLASLPVALERLQSSAWRTDGDYASLGVEYATQLSQFVQSFTSGVRIAVPKTGSYTLGSTSSSLPITVQNALKLPVRVMVSVTTVGSVPGFTAKNIGPQTIDAQSARTVQLPTTVARSGRIKVDVQLSAPDGAPLGDQLPLTVHSTALGRIGVIITIAAGVLLGLALIVRFVRGMRQRRRRRAGRPAVPDRTPVQT